MHNLDIRLKIKENRLFNYEVAEKLGITEYTFCKWLRNELSEEKKKIILDAIKKAVEN